MSLEELRRYLAEEEESRLADEKRIAQYRASMPIWRQAACLIGRHMAMPQPIRTGVLTHLGTVKRYECPCGHAYWLEDSIGRVRM